MRVFVMALGVAGIELEGSFEFSFCAGKIPVV